MRLSSWFRWTAILGVLALVGASDSHAFQNLDFESTGYPVDSNGVFISPDTCGDICYALLNSAVIMPGWTLSNELFDGSPVPPPYGIGGGFIAPGHIGGTTEFHLTDASEAILEGKHSLSFRAGSSVDFTQVPPDFNYDDPLPGDGYAYPVASQEGIIPQGTQSVVMVVDHSTAYVDTWSDDGSGFTFIIDEPAFTVRFDGFKVEMRAIDIADFPDATSEVPSNFYGVPHGVFFAGNIEPLEGSYREMSIRPEKGDLLVRNYELPTMELDAISFSAFPAPGPPIQLPEPSTAVLAIILLFAAGGGRGRFI